MLRRGIKAIGRFILFNSPLISILEYYNNFRTEYRLLERSKKISPVPSVKVSEFPPVSLIVLGHDSSERLQVFLDAVHPQLRTDDELIIVNSSEAMAKLKIENFLSFPKWVDAKAGSFGKVLNAAIQTGRHSMLVIADAGILPEGAWLSMLAGALASYPEASFAVAPIELPEQDYSFIRAMVLDEQKNLPYRNLAVWKNVWAQAGGFPETLDDYGAQEVFIARLNDKTEYHLVVPNPLARLAGVSSWKDAYRKSYLEGRLGLNAASVLNQFLLFVFPAILLEIISLFLLPFWPLIGLIGLLLGMFIAPVLWGRRLLKKYFADEHFDLLASVLAGWMQIPRFFAFALGVTKRNETREKLDNELLSQMREIVSSHLDVAGIILFSPMVDWSYMFQRYQQLARQFAKHNYLVFYRTDNRLNDTFVGFQRVEPNLFVAPAPLETFSEIDPLLFYINSPWLAPMIGRFANPIIIYDHCDDIRVSAGKIEDHETLLGKAAVTLASSSLLLEEDKRVHQDAVFLPNAVDYDRIMASAPKDGEPPPDDLQPILARKKPVIGYTGALAQWFDYGLLAELCRQSPEWEFVLIGTDYDHSLQASDLLHFENVKWLGLKPYDVLFRYTWRFDVTIIPFLVNEITLATSPIKLYEYFACQKPVVSTDLPECRKHKEVWIASGPEEFQSKIQRALIAGKDPKYIQQISEVARKNTWDARFDSLLQALKKSGQLRGGGN